eukprot:6880149-Karenia_brevis.AAC.1
MDQGRAVKFKAMWSIEINLKCVEEQLNSPDGPLCIFGDIRNFVHPSLRRAVGLDGGIPWSNRRLRKTLPKMRINK